MFVAMAYGTLTVTLKLVFESQAPRRGFSAVFED